MYPCDPLQPLCSFTGFFAFFKTVKTEGTVKMGRRGSHGYKSFCRGPSQPGTDQSRTKPSRNDARFMTNEQKTATAGFSPSRRLRINASTRNTSVSPITM